MPDFPLARRSSAIDRFESRKHGTVEVPNPYDWLEDTTTLETQAFVETQNASMTAYLDDPNLAEAKARLTRTLLAMWGLTAMPSVPRPVQDGFLLRVLGRGKEFGVSYRVSKDWIFGRNEHADGDAKEEEPVVFYDEATLGALLMASSPSRTGKYWAFQTSDHGSDWGVIRVKNIDTGETLPDEVRGTKFTAKPSTSIPWLGDRGFFYPFYPAAEGEGAARGGRPQLRFHEIGRPQEEDEIIHEDQENPWNTFKASVSQDDTLVFLEVYGKSRGSQIWSASVQKKERTDAEGYNLNGSHGSRLNLKFEHKVVPDADTEWEYVGTLPDEPPGSPNAYGSGTHLFWTSADNGKVMAYDPGAPANSKLKEIVPPHAEQTLKLARPLPGGNILVVRSIDVRDQIQIFSRRGRHLKTVTLRNDDDVPVWTIYDASPHDPATGAVFLVEFSFCRPPRIWCARATLTDPQDADSIEVSAFRPVELFPKAQAKDAAGTTTMPDAQAQPTAMTITPLSTRQVFYTSADGTRVPMFLTSADPYALTATTPVLLYIYGGFGISVVPHFRPDFVAFMHSFRGAVAVANVRGGGEYGQSWYTAACKSQRQALFDDVLGAARHLRSSAVGVQTIVLMGESMGALNAAAATVQEPSLFSAVLLNAGPLDVLHRRRLGLGDRGVQDIGDAHDPHDFDFIYPWTPLEKISNNSKAQRYPPVLLTAGDKDDLVSFSHSCKTVAALQYAAAVNVNGSGGSESGNVTNLRVTRNLGHMGNISAKEKAAVSLERWLWVKKTLGLDIYQ